MKFEVGKTYAVIDPENFEPPNTYNFTPTFVDSDGDAWVGDKLCIATHNELIEGVVVEVLNSEVADTKVSKFKSNLLVRAAWAVYFIFIYLGLCAADVHIRDVPPNIFDNAVITFAIWTYMSIRDLQK